jgi:hypothetical protein
VLTAYGLAELGQFLELVIPGDLSLFTGADLEALVTAGLAFGIHAGKKAKEGTAGPAVKVLAIAFLSMSAPALLEAQQSDSVVVTVVDRSGFQAVIVTDSSRFRGTPGDTVTFEAIVIDAQTGDTIAAEVTWTSNASETVTIDATTGLATFNGGCGAALCQATIFADVVSSFEDLRLFTSWPDGAWKPITGDPADAIQLEVGESSGLTCGYLISDAGLWFRSSPVCPSRPVPEAPQEPFPMPIDTRLGAMVG